MVINIFTAVPYVCVILTAINLDYVSYSRGPFVLALDKTWCPNHFVCANPHCKCDLVGIGFVEEGGQLFCERDYEQYFAPRCAKCGGSIMGVSRLLF